MVGRRGGAWAIAARLARQLMASHPPPHLPLGGGKDRKASYLPLRGGRDRKTSSPPAERDRKEGGTLGRRGDSLRFNCEALASQRGNDACFG